MWRKYRPLLAVMGRCTIRQPEAALIEKGDYVLEEKAGALYMVTKSSVKNGTVEYQESMEKVKGTATIPATITVDGITYKVTFYCSQCF